MSIKAILRKYKVTLFLLVQLRKIFYYVIPLILFNINKFLRLRGIIRNSPYEKLKRQKNKHKGERCFIVATGPSLTIPDLEKLKNEITFSMNSICLAFNETEWRPTYYGIQDPDVYKKLKKEIDGFDVECKFIGSYIIRDVLKSENTYVFPLNLLNHNVAHRKYHSKFSDNAFAVVYSGYSITYSLIQIAVYMGFEEIYLLGADCNYSSNSKHHFKEYGHTDPKFSEAHDQMTAAYKVAKEYAEHHNVKIYNATRGGMLEVFERVDLDKVLSEKTKSLIASS